MVFFLFFSFLFFPFFPLADVRLSIAVLSNTFMEIWGSACLFCCFYFIVCFLWTVSLSRVWIADYFSESRWQVYEYYGSSTESRTKHPDHNTVQSRYARLHCQNLHAHEFPAALRSELTVIYISGDTGWTVQTVSNRLCFTHVTHFVALFWPY